MRLDIHTCGLFQIVQIEDELEIITDLSELKFLIDGYITQGKHRIAVSFTDTSYIYSGAIAILLDCHKKLSQYDDGILCVLEPNKDIKTIFALLHIDKILRIYDSENDLPGE
jgi:anti-anti-sigma regulatory factor